MVSKMFKGKEIVTKGMNTPKEKIVRTQDYGMVLFSILRKYYYTKWFEFNGGNWKMHPSNKNKDVKLISGGEIIRGNGTKPNALCVKTKHTKRTYKQAYEEILNKFVKKRNFYHRGNGDWCMYDEERDAKKIKNLKKQNYRHPKSLLHKNRKGEPIPWTYKKGEIGETRWDDKRDGSGFGDLSHRHMGDGNDIRSGRKGYSGRV